MRFIFYTYCLLYAITSVIMNYCVFESVLYSKILASFSILVMAFVCMSPLAVILNPNLIKASRTDSKYMNFCLIAGGLRFVFWAVSIMGVRDHMTLLFLNAFGLSIFALLESRFKRISNEYFKY